MNQMKESDLFISFINPKLKDSEIENRFKSEMLSKSRLYNKYFYSISIIVLIVSIVVSIIFARSSENPKKIFQISLWSSVVLLLIMLISILLSCFKKESDFTQWLFTLINYSIFCLIFFLLRYTIYYSPVTNDLVHAVFYLGFLCKFIWIELALIDFWENFIVNFFIVVFSKFVQSFYFGWDSKIWIYVLVGDIIRLSSIILAYYILRKNRVIKYYYEKTNDLNIWYRDVLDNINSGFIKITNDKINFINKFSFDTCVQNEFIKPEEGNGLKYEDMTTRIENYSESIIKSIIETTKFIDIDKKMINLYNNTNKEYTNKVRSPHSIYDNQVKSTIKNEAIIVNEVDNEEINQISTTSPYIDTNHELLKQKNKEKVTKFIQESNTNIAVHVNSQKNITFPPINENCKETEEFNDIFSQVKAILKYKKSTMTNNKFFFLGTSITNEIQNYCRHNNSTHFELYGRYYKTETNEIVEFIFNDVTRTKIEEEKNAEIRYKSTLLSKMAHEFKSPIICLTEMITEELQNNLKIPETRYNMIKAVSNYLLILTKDIDTFSKLQIENDKPSNENIQRTNNQLNCNNNVSINASSFSKIKINELLSFIESIARYLISKKSFGNQIMFKIITYKGIPEDIFTDEIKLKQILINLLSNSIKFTNDGHIFLVLELDKNEKGYLKFSVEDTGIGITEEKKKKLFHCFESKNENASINKYGAGLGLTITNEMTRQIGKQLQFKSKEGKGSTFWFYVKMNYRKINSDICGEKINNALLWSKNLDLNNYDNGCNINNGKTTGKNDCELNHNNSLYYCKNNFNNECCDNNINNNNLKGNNCLNNSFSGNSEIINMKNYETIYDNISNVNLESNNNLPNMNSKVNRNSKNIIGTQSNIIQKNINNIINININNEIKNNEINNENNTSLESCKTDKLSELDLNAFPLISNNNSNINSKSDYSNSNSNTNENELISSDKEDQVIKTKKAVNFNRSKLIKLNKDQIHLDILNIIIADDVELERKAKIRKLKEYIKKKNIQVTLNFIEASDGLEILWSIFQIKKVKNNLNNLNPNSNFISINNISKIDFIISDENMIYYSGLKTAKKLYKLEKKLGLKHIPFYLSSGNYSLETLNNNKDIIDNILHKPLESYELNEIFKKYVK